MIYTAPCVMIFYAGISNTWEVGGGWALEILSFFWGSVKWHGSDRRVPFGAQKTRDFQGPTPPPLPQIMDLPASKIIS
jgi:hypothetical protein